MSPVTALPDAVPTLIESKFAALAPSERFSAGEVQRYLYLGRLRLYVGAVAREIGHEFTHTREAARRLAEHVQYLIGAFAAWDDLVKEGPAPTDDLVFDTISVHCACDYLAQAHTLLQELFKEPKPNNDPWDGEAISTIDRAYELVLGSERLLSLWQASRREMPGADAAYDRAAHKNVVPNNDDEGAQAVWAEVLQRLSEVEDATRVAGRTSVSYYELCRKHRALFLVWFHMLALYPGWWSADFQNDTTAALTRAALVMPGGPLQVAAERRVELFRSHFSVLPSSKDPIRYLQLAADPSDD